MKKLRLLLVVLFLLIAFTAQGATLFNYPKFRGTTSTGTALNGGLLYTYSPGTTTAKASYKDSAKASANTNPVVLDSNGEATVYLDGYYKIVLKDSAGVTVWTLDNVSGAGSAVIDYATIGDYGSDLGTAVTAIGATPTTLILNAATTCTGDVTIPATLQLKVEKAGVITISSGKTLTINGQLEAGLYQIFSGSGLAVLGSGITEAYPEWWGVDGTADDVQINAAIIALTAGSVKLASKTYNISATIYGDDNVTLYGNGISTILKAISDFGNTRVIRANDKTGFHVRDLKIDGNRANNSTGTTGSHGIQFSYVKKGSIRNCFIESPKGDGIYLGENYDTVKTAGCDDVVVTGNYIYDTARNGISIISGNRISVTDNIIKDNQDVVGIDIEPNNDLPLKDVTVAGNIIYNAYDCGISLNFTNVSTATNIKNILISNNVINTTVFSVGVNASYAWNTSFIGNQVFNSNSDGIYINTNSYDLIISGNLVDTAGRYGINLQSDRTIVSNNAFKNCVNTAMYVDSAAGAIITGNDVLSDAAYAVNLTGANLADYVFTGNRITSSAVNSNTGVSVTNGTNGIVANNIINNFATGLVRGTSSPDSVFIGSNISHGNTADYTDNIRTGIGTITFSPRGTSVIYSAAGAVTATLPDGLIPGDIKVIKMSNATASSTVSVTHHTTSDPEVFQFAQTTDVLILMWNGIDWVTISNQGVDTP